MNSDPSRRLEQLLWWLSTGLIAAGLVLHFAFNMDSLITAILIGMGIVSLGLNILLGGDIVVGPEPRSFSAKGTAAVGNLVIRAGLCDLTLGDGPNDRVAQVRFGPLGKPRFLVENGVAQLAMVSSLPNIATWDARLATNILWDIEAHSSLGHSAFDLTTLRLKTFTARTSFGQIALTCPEHDYTDIVLSTAAGTIILIIPDSVEAVVDCDLGRLAELDIKNKRLLAENQRRFVTDNTQPTTAQVAIQIRAAAGKIVIP